MEDTILDAVISAKFLQLNNFIQWALSSIPIPKCSHKVYDIKQRQCRKPIHQPMELETL
jgi:hypothetical protein